MHFKVECLDNPTVQSPGEVSESMHSNRVTVSCLFDGKHNGKKTAFDLPVIVDVEYDCDQHCNSMVKFKRQHTLHSSETVHDLAGLTLCSCTE